MTYKPMQKCANKHGVTVHSFRRTYAYLLKTQGIHVTTAQKLLGHSDPMMTLRVYTSVLDSEIDDAGDKLFNFLNPVGNKTGLQVVPLLNASKGGLAPRYNSATQSNIPNNLAENS